MTARIGALALLAIEGLGGFVIGAFTLIIGEAITPGYLPWRFAAAPLIFGLATLAVAIAYGRRVPSSRYLAIVIQVLIAAGAAIGLITSNEPTLWIALALGLVGIALVLADSKTDESNS